MIFDTLHETSHHMMDWLYMLPWWAWIVIGVVIVILIVVIIYFLMHFYKITQDNKIKSMSSSEGQSRYGKSEPHEFSRVEPIRPFCTQCGFKVPSDSSFCPNCGASIE